MRRRSQSKHNELGSYEKAELADRMPITQHVYASKSAGPWAAPAQPHEAYKSVGGLQEAPDHLAQERRELPVDR